MNIADVCTICRGEIELFTVRDGVEHTVSKKNTVVNTGLDILGMALAGERFVNGVYFAYDNADPAYVDPTPAVDRVAAFYHDDGGGTRNFIRAGTLARPSYGSTAPEYTSNKVTFVALTSGGGVLPGAGNVLTDGQSRFYGAGLVVLDPLSYTGDVLFSAVSFNDLGPAFFEKIVGAQFGIRWTIYFQP